MRIALALVLAAMPALGLPMAARAADTAQDRYGPPAPLRTPAPAAATVSYPTPDSIAREEASVAAEASGYHGRMLTWASKGGVRRAPAASGQPAVAQQAAAPPLRREAVPPQPPGAPSPRSAPLPRSLYGDVPAAPAAPAPVAAAPIQRPVIQRPAIQAAAQPAPQLPRRTPLDVSGPAPVRTAAASTPVPVRTAAPERPARAPQLVQAAARPVAERPAAAPPAQVASTGKPSASAPPKASAPAAAVQTAAAPAQPLVQAQVAMAAPPATPSAPVRARFYSLHRDYGDTPDPVTLPPARPPVLIGPDQTATAPAAPAGANGVAGDDANGAPDKPHKPQASAVF